MSGLEHRLGRAVAAFWGTRKRQQDRQARRGTRDQGSRGAATGGGQLDGCVDLVAELLVESGVPPDSIYRRKRADLPGFFRPAKQWDLIVVMGGNLLVSVEFKSQVGSFGNNYNNRTGERPGAGRDRAGDHRGRYSRPTAQVPQRAVRRGVRAAHPYRSSPAIRGSFAPAG